MTIHINTQYKPVCYFRPQGFKRTPIAGCSEWVAALRSGKYKQVTSRLKFNDGYCCLGVKSELDGLQHTVTKCGECIFTGRFGVSAAGYMGNCGLSVEGALPLRISINKTIPKLWTLANLNDRGFPFTDIATIIEEFFTDK